MTLRWWRPGLGLTLGAVLLVAPPGRAGVLDASWTAPTTNTDGSALTDLAFYRVYFGPATAPCPGPAFFQIASPTSSPQLNETVSARLTGLATGTLYHVSVSALDTEGNESPCSIVASAVAQRDFAVTPISTLSFGSVPVGSFVDQTFSVQSTRGGTVSGTVSTSAPFSVVSGSPFTLVGTGASQTVTVRFSPSVVAVATVSVNFTAGGDTIPRIATGIGTSGHDPSPPTVTITSPTSIPTYTTNSSPLTLGGTASDNVGVTRVTWVNSRGGSGTATGTTSWTASGIVLQPGSNVLIVTASDAAGNTATTTLTVTLTQAFAFTDDPVVARSTPITALHIVELRTSIDSVRLAPVLSPFAWTDPALTPGVSKVKAVHLAELRTALDEAYQAAGRVPPAYTDPTIGAGLTVIKAVHLNELRAAVRALFQ